MPTNILMPALSPTMEKGNLAKWLKKEGDKVKSGDVIAEIETDKATMEVEAVDEGTLAKIIVPEGTQDVPVNEIIAVLAGDGEDVKAAGAGAAKPAASNAPPQKAAEAPAAAKPASAPAAAAAPKAAAPAAAAPAAQTSAPQSNGHDRIFSSPLARRLAKEAGVDLARVSGSGPHGRIIAKDVEEAKSGKGLKAPAAAPAGAPAIAPSMSDKQIRALYEDGSYEVIPHDGMRRTIAQRLTASMQTIPHFYLTVDCNIGLLVEAREQINAAAPKDKDGKPAYKLSVNDFVIKALAVALQRVPDANVSWTEGHRRSGRDAGRIDHADHPQGRNQAGLGDIGGDEGFRRTRPSSQAQARRISGRHHGGVQPRHVRHQGIHRGDQSAARHHPRGRRRRAACDREERQGRGGGDNDRDVVLRSPRSRRRARRPVDQRVQDAG
jgi:pyruvate dehydrogenase E2 component (dihydrolipoamide acetyltransferase)